MTKNPFFKERVFRRSAKHPVPTSFVEAMIAGGLGFHDSIVPTILLQL
ncbi:hypothetical protein MHI18_05115 [Peribacillus sp. FSL H8-0477]